jgi:hypothetical protein
MTIGGGLGRRHDVKAGGFGDVERGLKPAAGTHGHV